MPSARLSITLCLLLVAIGAAAQPPIAIPAQVATNVSDADGDGLGDESADPPSGLISAGVDGSGGPGNNGTRRLQFEWPLADLEPIGAAFVVLDADRGTVDQLDTFFFTASASGDGLVSASDFETDATRLPGVVMPVSIGDGLFAFEVTSAARRAQAMGFTHLVVQARVDESLAGGGSKRGLQVRSNAGSNPVATHPQLVLYPELFADDFESGDLAAWSDPP